MATQRILLFSIGGLLADDIWTDICHWSNDRTVSDDTTFSPADWPVGVCDKVDAFVKKVGAFGLTPPVLYRSEHVDCWSMGDVYETAIVKPSPKYCRQLCTKNNEVIATWVRFTERIVADKDAAPETSWLYNRVNEAIAAWSECSEYRLIVLVRSVFGVLWEDSEVADSLKRLPEWWTNN